MQVSKIVPVREGDVNLAAINFNYETVISSQEDMTSEMIVNVKYKVEHLMWSNVEINDDAK
ncbi:hypothetical protein T4B_11339 [Trichinella pseudospiralis]|uniref:Uncharacterized protein n=1 Tax=Trichinella pseudospiralis TaxID=6337 RepID=A0A0V1J8T3_TRIPS|nr:hypothetical protein T4B_11339 [Trichinella pseudospiralis]